MFSSISLCCDISVTHLSISSVFLCFSCLHAWTPIWFHACICVIRLCVCVCVCVRAHACTCVGGRFWIRRPLAHTGWSCSSTWAAVSAPPTDTDVCKGSLTHLNLSRLMRRQETCDFNPAELYTGTVPNSSKTRFRLNPDTKDGISQRGRLNRALEQCSL